jgi:hypothetical protein
LPVASELQCPVCNADLPLSGDEQGGDEIYCTYCGAPCRMKQGSDGDLEAEQDF